MLKLSRRALLQLAASAGTLSVLPRRASAQAYPTRPVRMIVPFPPGASADIVARLIGQWLSARLGQAFVIENRSGAGGNVGTETVARASADGYSLLLATSANAINATLYDRLDFDFVRDIAPVASISHNPLVLAVHPSVPVRTVGDFITYAKANPGKINMASASTGTPHHVAGELFKLMTGIDMVHVPYRGEAPALTDLIAGRMQVMFVSIPASIQHIGSGKVRPLAVTTSARVKVLPDVPTVAETVHGYEASGWFGIGAPKQTPSDVIALLNKETNAAVADPVFQSRLGDLGLSAFCCSPSEFGSFIAAETDKWGRVVRSAVIKPG